MRNSVRKCHHADLIYSVGGGRVTVHLRVADAASLVGSDLDVASIAPSWAPGVSDNPVVLAFLRGAIADHGDGVVNLLRA